MMFSEYKDIVTIEELQDMLRIGRSKAYQLLRSGHIKALHDGRVWLIPKKSVIEYVIGRCG
ncbi:MAG: helix-turn-helix domain-containing protein [Oscillospiraceae bacterium]|nr:helix-turn-helix domain-containing protein [Oscillospiraceae bacterium]